MNTSLAHSPQNDTRYDDLVKEVAALGRDAASGKDSLPKLAHRLVRAAHEGVISTQVGQDGLDDAHRLYTSYAEKQSKTAIHEHTAGGFKANVSKMRKLIEMGSMPIIDPVDVMNRTVGIRQKMQEADEATKPAYASYVDVAREQLANPGRALTDDEIKGVCAKPAPAEKTVDKILKDCHKKLERLITGEGGLKDQSEQVIAAEEALRTRLAAFAMEAAHQQNLHRLVGGADRAAA